MGDLNTQSLSHWVYLCVAYLALQVPIQVPLNAHVIKYMTLTPYLYVHNVTWMRHRWMHLMVFTNYVKAHVGMYMARVREMKCSPILVFFG
jgi:hypothetical protein